jgi:hypothetical protein
MTQSITFKSAIPDEAKSARDGLGEPAGIEHAKMIRSHLGGSMSLLGDPWNEEDYAWEFQVGANRITMSVIVGAVDDEWRVQVLPVAFLGFLRRKRLHSAVNAVADAVEEFLTGDPRFKDVCRSVEP